VKKYNSTEAQRATLDSVRVTAVVEPTERPENSAPEVRNVAKHSTFCMPEQSILRNAPAPLYLLAKLA